MSNSHQISFLAPKDHSHPKATKPHKTPVWKILQPLIRLSPTTGLNLFRDCPRCFYLHHNRGVHRPRGIFPSLPSGMDLVIKDYFDHYRGSLPPELVGNVGGTLVANQSLMNRWRNWRTGMEYNDTKNNAVLFGALDDCLQRGDQYIPLDYKTKGSAPQPGDSERYYQVQLDTYSLLLKENGFPVAGFGYLVYYYPKLVAEGGQVAFFVHPVRIETNPDRVRDLFASAIRLLRGTRIPPRHTNCEYCVWNEDMKEFD